MSLEIIKTGDVIDAVTGLVKSVPVYQDIAQPAVQEVGKALHTVAKTVHIALAPISALVWGYEQLKEFISTKVAERLQNIPPENIITPKPNIAGPILESLRYTGHEPSLSELYANLLATAMDKSSADGAHPAFVEIIKQLTSDEAKLISLLQRKTAYPIITLRKEYRSQKEGNSGGFDVISNYSHLGALAQCEFPEMTPSYIDNLCRLGLSEVPVLFQYTSKGVYDALESDPKIKTMVVSLDSDVDWKPVIERKGLRVTQLGTQFIKTCVVKK